MDRRPQDNWRNLVVFGLTTLATCLALIWLAGCSNVPQNNQQVKQQAAQTTQQVKAGAQQAAADAKVAAANAVDKVNAVAAGVKEGLHGSAGSVSPDAVDINSASEARLVILPGITTARAQRIIENRPYPSTHDLVSKGALTQAEYDRISGQIVTRNN